MKTLLVAIGFCVVAVLAAPDAAIKLEDHTANTVHTGPEPGFFHTPGTTDDRTKLVAKLLDGYNAQVYPDNVKVDFGVSLIDLRVREENNVLETYSWLKLTWNDSRLLWNPEDYGGVKVMRLNPKNFWIPDITLYNSADPVNMINCWESNVLVYSTGTVLWVPPCKMHAHCSFDLKKHPYGEQNCFLKFGSWTYDGLTMDVQFYGGNKTIDLSDMQETSGFEVVSSTAQRNERFYSCCKEPYIDLTFNITIKRIPGDELFAKL